jgi:23S rRNA G2069 N7-methylase RlmK/C1962 C5-methylase RlmI
MARREPCDGSAGRADFACFVIQKPSPSGDICPSAKPWHVIWRLQMAPDEDFDQFADPSDDDTQAPDSQRVFDESPAWRQKCVEMFGNRLAKNSKHLRKWAKRELVNCYRVYDQDIPEVPIVVDVYDGAFVLGDYRMHDLEGHRRGGDEWLDAMAAAIANVMKVDPTLVHVKGRQRFAHRGEGQQYDRQSSEGSHRIVHEGDLKFIVNLTDYLDTGLFLDHRLTRRRVAAETFAVRTPKMLNLFCYTGAFSVHAAAAGMLTTSVDMSRTYVDWAAANLHENQFDLAQHTLVQSDVRQFLDGAITEGEQYQVIVVDPPTFSNSKRMDYTWDVQRDHPMLLADVARITAPGGVIWFSTNRRKFNLDVAQVDELDGAVISNETAATMPQDFRNRKVHHAYRIVMPPARR